jgi:hypothetical protein
MTQKISFYHEKIKNTLNTSKEEIYETKEIQDLFGNASSEKPMNSVNK